MSLRELDQAKLQKAFDQLNVKVHTVIGQINGVSGLAVVRAILKGERDEVPDQLTGLRGAQHVRARFLWLHPASQNFPR